MSISKEFNSLFNDLVEQYGNNNLSRYLKWNKDTHAETILENLKFLQSCFVKTPDIFDEDDVLNFLKHSAVMLFSQDPIFLAHMGTFTNKYAEITQEEHHIGVNLFIKFNTKNSKVSLIGNLMQAISKEREAHCLEIEVYTLRIQELEAQIAKLTKELRESQTHNEELERHKNDNEGELHLLREKVTRYEHAWDMIEEASHAVNLQKVIANAPAQLVPELIIKENKSSIKQPPILSPAMTGSDLQTKPSPVLKNETEIEPPTQRKAPPAPPVPPRPVKTEGGSTNIKPPLKLKKAALKPGQPTFFSSMQEELDFVLKTRNSAPLKEPEDKKGEKKNSCQNGSPLSL
ncbi:hypothetical protein B1207_13500 [Legionella quinlivanii]|uniref:VipA n=1 Tax=Legionella quinlivanii TaxID=45073 RepID=A0A364LG38_9GAMM|nr:hypothetical protein [Legionella quinlivanii]RAP35118.1 hypothetical protein B1207_13500 [Legionella quinlivanii]